MDHTAERVAKNDAAFREANEQIEQRAAAAEMVLTPFICECADEGCTSIVRLTLDEYEQIRANGRWFLNVPGHESSAAGYAEVVRRAQGYVVVEKTGAAGAIVEQLDPRSREIRR